MCLVNIIDSACAEAEQDNGSSIDGTVQETSEKRTREKIVHTRKDVMNLFSLNTFIGSSIFLSKPRDQEMAPETMGAFRDNGGLSCAEKEIL